MRKTNWTVILATLLAMPAAIAHEGHNHGGGSEQAPHGGVIKANGPLRVELVQESDALKIYVMDEKLKTVPAKDLKVEATTQAPKKPKAPLKLSSKTEADGATYYEGKLSDTGSYRYQLEVSIAHGGKNQKVSFQVEPQD